jgi:methyl-accepting chemotaxis protein
MSLTARGTNLPISTKITASFIIILMVVTALCGTALQKFSILNATVVNFATNSGPSLNDLAAMRTAFAAQLRILTLSVLQADDKAALLTTDAAYASARKDFLEIDAKYAPMVDPGTETELSNTISTTYKTFDDQVNGLRDLVRAGNTNGAKSYLLVNLNPAAEKIDAVLKADMDYNAALFDHDGVAGAAAYTTGRMFVAGFGGLAVLVAVVVGFTLVRSIATPIKAMTLAMRRLSARDMSGEIPALERSDEVGQMAQSVQAFKDGIIAADQAGVEQTSERAAKERRAAGLERAVDEFEATAGGLVQELASASGDLDTTARLMTATADRTNSKANAVAAAAQQAGAGVQTVAAAAEQLTASINEISRQVGQSAETASRAVQDAQRTNTIVMALAEGAQKIGNVVSLITNIAGQTNLLALNATIEAARAGDAGKGFAVVASEVKNLAAQTGRATEEIGAQVTQIQAATTQAVEAIRRISATIDEISGISTTIASAVEQQGAATAEIARNVQQTALAAQNITSNIGGVSQAANESSATADQVLEAAGGMAKQAIRFSAAVDGFVAGVRAA